MMVGSSKVFSAFWRWGLWILSLRSGYQLQCILHGSVTAGYVESVQLVLVIQIWLMGAVGLCRCQIQAVGQIQYDLALYLSTQHQKGKFKGCLVGCHSQNGNPSNSHHVKNLKYVDQHLNGQSKEDYRLMLINRIRIDSYMTGIYGGLKGLFL